MSNAAPRGCPSRQRPSAALVLAAVERAQHHRRAAGAAVAGAPGASVRNVLDHLLIGPRSADARDVRGALRRLAESGALARARSHGVEVFALTGAGRRRLARERAAGTAGELPESPQHRAWRNARTAAALEIERSRSSLALALADGTRLLDAHPAAHSDEWFVLGERLRAAARRVGSACHCLYEWGEPDDALADVDERSEPGDGSLAPVERTRVRALRAGRRNIRLWQGNVR
jgi:hypothetical protein